MSAAEHQPEDAVRRYLTFLEDPSKLRDESEVQRRTVAVLEASDPIEKLKALTALEQASAVNEDEVRDGFVRHAKAWADDHSVSVRAFRELRVPLDVLGDAGFDITGLRSRRPQTSVTPTHGSVARSARRTSVTQAEIRDAVLGFSEPFTLNGVMDKVGGSPMTIRKAVDELIAEGKVERRGPVPGYSGRGRAPIEYAVL